jgi:polyisoprenoid-binding protein YceI
MKKAIFLSFFLITAITAFSQKYMTRNGYISFFSHTPVEDIEAKNNQVTSIIDAETGEMVFKVLMKSFQFEKALMQEHFNEKYVESDKFPNADFLKATIKDWNLKNIKEGKPMDVIVEGELTIHGVTKKISEKGTLELKSDGKLVAKAAMKLRPEDYGIKIPAVVRGNIAEIMDVFIEATYSPMITASTTGWL